MDYSDNSNKNKKAEKPERPKVEKVITGEATERKKSFGSKFKGVFFGGDFKSTVSYVTGDILFPALRNMIADAGKGAVDRAIYGDRRPMGRNGLPHEYGSRVRYNNPINRATRPDPRDPRGAIMPVQPALQPYRSNRSDPAEVVVPDREEAEVVLERLIDLVDQYDTACLADLYELVGLQSNHTDQKWGWTNLVGAQITQVREGYLIQLPPMEAL